MPPEDVPFDDDRHAPRWHVRPPHGWVNDPNGVGRWDDRWHVMYQWNPHGTTWGSIHWGHASSPDLLRWEHEPVALAPRPGGVDAAGAWSGVAVHDDGDVALVYSAARDDAASAGVAVARRGPDGGWRQPDRLTVPHPAVPGVTEVRDPFLLTVDGRRLAVQGAAVAGVGGVLAYEVTDLDDWRPLGTLLTAADVPAGLDAPGRVWECPQLVEVDGVWVLLVSWFDRDVVPERLGVTAFTGRLHLTSDGARFEVEGSWPLDEGPDLYAPHVHVADGRALVWGWAWEGTRPGAFTRSAHEIAASGWAGTLTCPRELVVRAGRPVLVPARELAGLRGAPLPVGRRDGAAELLTDEVAWRAAAVGDVAVLLVDDAGEVPVWVGDGPVEILADGSLLEVFRPATSTTLRVYPRGGQRWCVLAGGGLEAQVLRVPPA